MPVKISTNMSVDEILTLSPDSAVILQNAGLKCTGCDARTERKLKEFVKDLSPAEVDKILDHLNKLKQEDELEKPSAKDFELEEIKEGNKMYFKIAGLLFSENAYSNLHQLKTAKGLRIRLSTGGCSGFKYDYDFFDAPLEDEKIYKMSDELELYMSDFSFGHSKGSVVDFSVGLHASGLQIINPNKKRSCSCGTSFGF